MKKIKAVIASFALAMMVSAGVNADQDVKININGQRLYSDVAPQIINGRTMVPLRAIFEKYGIEPQWSGYEQSVRAQKGNFSMLLNINSNIATVNGKSKYVDQPALIINGRTMVPLRFITETLGSEVGWDGPTSTVSITTDFSVNPKYEAQKGYERAYSSLLNQLSYRSDMPSLKANLFDIDKDGVPELLTEFLYDVYTKVQIYEFKNGTTNLIYDSFSTHARSYEFHNDLSGQLYIQGNFRYYIYAGTYDKLNGFREVYFHDADSGETEYKNGWFDMNKTSSIRMQPVTMINF